MKDIIEKFKVKIFEIKEKKKEDTWFWFILGYTVAFLLIILEDMLKAVQFL